MINQREQILALQNKQQAHENATINNPNYIQVEGL